MSRRVCCAEHNDGHEALNPDVPSKAKRSPLRHSTGRQSAVPQPEVEAIRYETLDALAQRLRELAGYWRKR
jgi:hypothetical protein